MKRLYITDEYKYYEKEYENSKMSGVQDWQSLRNKIENDIAEKNANDINFETYTRYGFIYGTEKEYNKIVSFNKNVSDCVPFGACSKIQLYLEHSFCYENLL